ncbi:VOC family protein [Jatrophihabitans sp. DSM 45814]
MTQSLPETADFATELGATFDHFAIATRRIRDLIPLWRDCLGGRFAMGADDAVTGWRTVRLEFGEQVPVELIEPLQGSTFFDKFFQSHPNGGLHHVTFMVDDVQDAFQRLERDGFAPFGADENWFQLFVHPRQAHGVLVQLMVRRSYDSVEMTLEDVYAGRGARGTGLLSP